MKRVRLKIAYDGTNYCGFQVQPDLPTIEGVLNSAISELTGEKISVTGASRTDAGVHAYGNIAVFDTDSPIPPDKFFLALNPLLPDDITIVSSDEVQKDWHPRKQDCEKTYIYQICNSKTEDPKKRLYAMHFSRPLDVDLMKKGAEVLLGKHDFTSFANPSSQILKEGGSPVRTITDISVEKESGVIGDMVTVTVSGDGFLYNMVRIIAGTLIDAGTGRFSPSDIEKMLEAKDRCRAGMTAEARGLTLKEIRYINSK